MTTPTTVTYFRTGLDMHDGYRLADIFSGGDADTSTPAAMLAVHLREVNPAVSWFDDVDIAMEVGLETHRPMHLDAVTFEHAGSAHVIMAIKTSGIIDPGCSRRFAITTSQWCRDSTYALATSFGLEEKTYRAGDPVRLEEGRFYHDAQVSERLAHRTESFVGNSTRLHFYTTVNGRGATPVETPPLDGFETVSWGSPRWRTVYRDTYGTHAISDIAGDDTAPIMSSIAQGAGYTPIVELRHIN